VWRKVLLLHLSSPTTAICECSLLNPQIFGIQPLHLACTYTCTHARSSSGSSFQLLSTCLILLVPSMVWTERAVPDMPQVWYTAVRASCDSLASSDKYHTKTISGFECFPTPQARSSGGMAEVTLAKGKALLVVGGWSCDTSQTCGCFARLLHLLL
jgi:hypothetical protein